MVTLETIQRLNLIAINANGKGSSGPKSPLHDALFRHGFSKAYEDGDTTHYQKNNHDIAHDKNNQWVHNAPARVVPAKTYSGQGQDELEKHLAKLKDRRAL
jgi:hypothetical protein